MAGVPPLPERCASSAVVRQRQGIDTKAVGIHERVENDIKCLPAAIERFEGRDDLFGSPNF
jgi:hypothetical protein